MNINPLIDLIGTVISLYNWVLIAWIILSWLIAFNIINRYQPFVSRVMDVLSRLTEPVLGYIRRYIPLVAGIDLSPIILFLALGFLKSVLYTYLYN